MVLFYFYDGCGKLIVMGDSVVRGMDLSVSMERNATRVQTGINASP